MPTAKAMDRIVPFLEKEVPHTQDYGRLVDVLMVAGQIEKARQCCVEGFGKTCKESPDIASGLHKRLRSLAVSSGIAGTGRGLSGRHLLQTAEYCRIQGLTRSRRKTRMLGGGAGMSLQASADGKGREPHRPSEDRSVSKTS
jgi:hypothetical protein